MFRLNCWLAHPQPITMFVQSTAWMQAKGKISLVAQSAISAETSPPTLLFPRLRLSSPHPQSAQVLPDRTATGLICENGRKVSLIFRPIRATINRPDHSTPWPTPSSSVSLTSSGQQYHLSQTEMHIPSVVSHSPRHSNR